ncbi:hypothetical protein JRO89_XS03G0072400 [Xanthoceras sorbifolium]|uniref:Uncharacterized protein n=1 Tax=Xanthoceras sorbifolium TaxID=99658 RepID=A0ABQ8I924_9ROSI|nr:hypothetical protein JRO89_XS03G0072400 [Xanthoceras sorbifolium]
MEDPLEDRAEAYVEDSADDRVDDDRVEDQAEPHMEDPPENRVDDDRVEDPAKAHVEALAEDRVDDDGVLKDRVDDRVEDAADDRVKLEKEYGGLLPGFLCSCHIRLMQGSGVNGLDEFMISELPKSLNNYASTMIGFVVDGIGNFLGILFVYANRQLFSATMNESHLGKYNFQLMILSFLNMCYYYPISVIYILIRYARSDMVERDHITINQ